MRCRIAVVLTIAVACCQAQLAIAQNPMGKQKGKVGPGFDTPWGKKSSPLSSRVVEDTQTPAPAFLVTLEERAKERKVFLPYIEGTVGGPRGVAQDPYVATVCAIRRIRGEEPATGYVQIGLRGQLQIPEEDLRKIIQFKKEYAKKVAPLAEHVESASLTLRSHGLVLNFNLKTGECYSGSVQVPDGFFDALSDALADLEKLKAGKPAFQVK
jgi:hypothetical protein